MRCHHLLEGLKLKRLTVQSVGDDAEKLEISYTAGGNKKMIQFWKILGQFLKKVNIN